MDKYVINGGGRLCGSVALQSAKNSVLPLFAASILTDKRVIILDDMVDTGGSLCGAAQALVELGGATEVYACASHGVLSGPAVDRIEKSVIKEVIFLDTVPARSDVKCDKIKYLSVAHMFAEAIERIYEEVSVSKLFV